MAISLSGTDSHRSSDGAIQSHRVSNNGKRRSESPIAAIFSAFQTSSISTKAGSQMQARLREFIDLAWLRGIAVAIGLCSLAFAACQYDVPITSSPTRNVEQRLLGNWVSLDGKENMKVRRLDDNTYVVYYDGD